MKSKSSLRQRALVLAVAAGCGLACSFAFAVTPVGRMTVRLPAIDPHDVELIRYASLQSTAPVRRVTPVHAVGNSQQFVTLSQSTRLGSGDKMTGPMALMQSFHVTLALKLRNASQLQTLNAGQHAPIDRATLEANYLPTAAQAQSVVGYLQRSGFRDINVSADRMLVNAVGSGAAVHAAFRTNMVQVQTSDGRAAFANSAPVQIPASLRDDVVAVTGLQTVHQAHTMVQPLVTAAGVAGHNPVAFASIYDATSLPAATSINVAVWGWGSMQQTLSDLQKFITQNSLPALTPEVVCTDDGGKTVTNDSTCGLPDEGSVEWNMDSQDILGMTGGVKSMVFYAADSASNDALLDSLDEIVTPTAGEPKAQVINASFGECERYEDSNQGGDGSLQAWDQEFALAQAQGQTFSVSTGDSGYDECGDEGMNSASYPASSPSVVAVSGTTLNASSTTWARENAWFDAGGSPSSAEKSPAWQTLLTYGTYAGQRGPDVAFDANPASGAIYFWYGNPIQVGGTSLAAPLFAGAWARILQSKPTLGFAAPVIYALPSSVFHDIYAGNNRGDDPKGGYLTQRGWDWATGFGSMDVAKAEASAKAD
jgi:subtilase family serine protease